MALANDHCPHYFFFLDQSVGGGFFHRRDNDITDTGIPPAGTA
jgi:hypothetical protein